VPAARLVLAYGVDIPLTDEWAILPLLRKLAEGRGLAFEDWWHFHNEHRPMFPRMLIVGLARLSSWDITWELRANLVLTALSTALVVGFYWRLARPAGLTLVPLAVSTLFFSPVQWHNWLWGWQVEVFLCVFGALLALVLLSVPGLLALAGSVAAATLSALSYGSGLCVWIAGVPLAAFASGGRLRWVRIGVWTAAGAALVYSYFQGYKRLGHHPPLALVTSEPAGVLGFVAAYLGAPLTQDGVPWATAVGAVGLLGFVVLVLLAARGALRGGRLALLAIALGAFAIGSAIITAQARLGFGAHQAAISRYTSFGLLLWVSLVLLAEAATVPRRARTALHVVVVVLSLRASATAWPRALDRSDALATARLALREPDYAPDRLGTDPRFKILLPRPASLAKSIEFLRAHRLSVYRETAN
jgi:hypothetical protein